jgi:hypothetical protein
MLYFKLCSTRLNSLNNQVVLNHGAAIFDVFMSSSPNPVDSFPYSLEDTTQKEVVCHTWKQYNTSNHHN